MSFVLPRFVSLLISGAIGLGAMGAADAATYYVRTDGGDAKQCNGRADAKYPGSGTGLNCAWKHPNFALPSKGAARIVGGDTLLIGPGEYMIGYGAPGTTCDTGDRTACGLGRIPSGTTSARTRILGSNPASPPKLWGAESTWAVITMHGSSNVELGHLEITDKDKCVNDHTVAAAACRKSGAPYGNWASMGITASNSGNVWIHDVNIHGMATNAVRAGGLTNWTFERVRMNANGWAGWDMNVGSNSSNSGRIIMRDVEIAWNGCGQDPSTGTAVNCWGQKAGGYGDGLGTITTGGEWILEDMFVHHNTSDGLDLLYLNGKAGTSATLRRVHAFANAGNQVKVKGTTTIENSVIVGWCSYFAGRHYMKADDQCRASGDAISITLAAGNVATVQHNTVIGEGASLVMTTGGDSTSRVNLRNNVLIGMTDYLARLSGTTRLSSAHAAYNSSAAKNYSGNLLWNVRNNVCLPGSVCGKHPGLKNMTLAGFDATPLAGSPVLDKAPVLSAVTTDFFTARRPSGAAPDIGAIEVPTGQAAAAPPPTSGCTRSAPAITLTGPTTAVAAGTRVSYTLKLTNRDSSGCANTAFNLARTVPSGWTGTLSATSVTLAPGASASATLNVTSATSAAGGSHGIGAGASSSAGGTHTVSASATYAVAGATSSTGLAATASTDKATYIGGTTANLRANVTFNGQAANGAAVKFDAVKPNGSVVTLKTTTGSDGVARASFATGTGSSSLGTYTLKATVTHSGKTVTVTSSFKVSS